MQQTLLTLFVVLLILIAVMCLGIGIYQLDYFFIFIGICLIAASYLLKREFKLYFFFWKE